MPDAKQVLTNKMQPLIHTAAVSPSPHLSPSLSLFLSLLSLLYLNSPLSQSLTLAPTRARALPNARSTSSTKPFPGHRAPLSKMKSMCATGLQSTPALPRFFVFVLLLVFRSIFVLWQAAPAWDDFSFCAMSPKYYTYTGPPNSTNSKQIPPTSDASSTPRPSPTPRDIMLSLALHTSIPHISTRLSVSLSNSIRTCCYRVSALLPAAELHQSANTAEAENWPLSKGSSRAFVSAVGDVSRRNRFR